MHQSRTKVENYRDYHYPQPTCMDGASPSVPYHIMTPNYNIPMSTCQADYRYIEDTNAIPGNYKYFPPIDHGFVNQCSAYGCLPHGNKYFRGVPSNPYYTTMPTYARVPTGRLIELDMPVSVANYDRLHNRKTSHRTADSDEVDFYRRQSSDGDQCDYGKVDKKPAKSLGDRHNYDTWDFVYRNLESLGYSKDLGDREDILHKREHDSRTSKQKSFKQNDNDETYSAHHLEKRRSGKFDVNDIDSSVTNGRHYHHDTLPFKKKSSSFDLTDSNRYHADASSENHPSSHNKDKKHGSQTLPIQRSHRSSDQISKITDTLKGIELSHSEKGKGVDDKNKWNCATCTYLNSSSKEICEMCGKSRHKGNEDKPLASGGRVCPQCTLVNEQNAPVCDACDTSLKDSPTYI